MVGEHWVTATAIAKNTATEATTAAMIVTVATTKFYHIFGRDEATLEKKLSVLPSVCRSVGGSVILSLFYLLGTTYGIYMTQNF